MKNCCLILIISLCYLNGFAINYFVSNNGNDTNNGKTDSKSWKTIDRLNRQKLLPGDTVFFKCGDVFSGEVVVQFSVKEKEPIV